MRPLVSRVSAVGAACIRRLSSCASANSNAAMIRARSPTGTSWRCSVFLIAFALAGNRLGSTREPNIHKRAKTPVRVSVHQTGSTSRPPRPTPHRRPSPARPQPDPPPPTHHQPPPNPGHHPARPPTIPNPPRHLWLTRYRPRDPGQGRCRRQPHCVHRRPRRSGWWFMKTHRA